MVTEILRAGWKDIILLCIIDTCESRLFVVIISQPHSTRGALTYRHTYILYLSIYPLSLFLSLSLSLTNTYRWYLVRFTFCKLFAIIFCAFFTLICVHLFPTWLGVQFNFGVIWGKIAISSFCNRGVNRCLIENWDLVQFTIKCSRDQLSRKPKADSC